MLKWIVVPLAVLVTIVVLIAIVGALLPTGHVARVSLALGQPPDSVWAVIRDLGGYADWWPDVREMERRSEREGLEVWVQIDRRGQRMPLMVQSAEPPRRLVTRILDQDLPYGGTWTQEIQPTPTGSVLTVTERGQVYNPFFRFMARFVLGYHGTMESYLRALAARFDEEPVLTRSEAS